MAHKLEKNLIVSYNDCDDANKVNWNYFLINVFLKNYKKTGNYHQKKSKTTKGTLTTIPKENNHFLCVYLKPEKLH